MSWPVPKTLDKDEWPPDYTSVYGWRQEMVLRMRRDPRIVAGMEEHYRDNPWDFVNHWCVTYDPRKAASKGLTFLPFIMFRRQEDFVRMLHEAVTCACPVLVDKSRDMGVTWLACAVSVWLWRFYRGSSVGWGSRKLDLVDRLGDADSIFEKMRIILRYLPRELRPLGFSTEQHTSFMKIVNPENGATITGECGDNIGRGGRNLVYFVDEAAHLEHPELVEAALMSNTNVPVDISTVNGPASVFQRKRDAGKTWVPGSDLVRDRTNVFIFDYSDHPEKTPEWYAVEKSAKSVAGLAHVFAQEVDRDPAAAITGTIIKSEWIRAAVGAGEKLGIARTGMWGAGLDVADDGPDLNALAIRRGIFLESVEEWGACRGDETARRAVDRIEGFIPLDVEYDCIGVGAAVKSEAGRLADERKLPRGIRFVPWSAAASPLDPDGYVVEDDRDSPVNGDFFANLKAQGWWQLARRFERTFRALNDPDFKYDTSDLISINPSISLLQQLVKELSQPVMTKSSSLKLVVDKMPSGQRSPNLGDAVMQAFWPSDARRPMIISPSAVRSSRSIGERSNVYPTFAVSRNKY